MVSKQDETFLAIAQAGSVSKAAQGLYLSQPAVSRSLKRLEEDLGAQLFDREAVPLRLTQAGERYLRYVRENQERERRLRQDLAQLEREPSGTVRVGLNFWRSSLVLPRVLPAFQRQPHSVGARRGLPPRPLRPAGPGKLDFALFTGQAPAPSSPFSTCGRRILLFLRRDAPCWSASPLQGDRGLPHLSWPELSALQDTPFLLLKKGQNLREQAEYIFQSPASSLPAALTTLSLTALGLAERVQGRPGLRGGAGRGLSAPSLLPFTVGDPPVRWEVGFASRAGVPLSRPRPAAGPGHPGCGRDGPAQAGAPSAPL